LRDNELWKSDGTPAGTSLVFTFDAAAVAGSPPRARLAVADGKLLINAVGLETGQEPFVSDGTTAGTRLLKDINPGVGSSLTRLDTLFLFACDDRFFFPATNGITSGLWTSDGTADGTLMMASASPYAVINDTLLMRSGSTLAKLVERESL
jgi:ELWxxDGT repeat protein